MILCSICASDEYVTYDPATRVVVCDGPAHPTERVWELVEPTKHPTAVVAANEPLRVQKRLFEDLPACLLVGEWADTGVVEHRYGQRHPETYAWMIERWGHVAMGERPYSSTSFIGSALGDLSRTPAVAFKAGGVGTGMYRHNRTIGLWTRPPVLDNAVDMTWERFAYQQGFHPKDFPLLGYHHAARGT